MHTKWNYIYRKDVEEGQKPYTYLEFICLTYQTNCINE